MDEEFKVLLRKNIELSKENNRLLRKMRRNAIIGNILRIIWWAVIIGLPIYLYFTVFQPYLQELATVYKNIQTEVGEVGSIFNRIPFIGSYIENFNSTTSELVRDELSR